MNWPGAIKNRENGKESSREVKQGKSYSNVFSHTEKGRGRGGKGLSSRQEFEKRRGPILAVVSGGEGK